MNTYERIKNVLVEELTKRQKFGIGLTAAIATAIGAKKLSKPKPEDPTPVTHFSSPSTPVTHASPDQERTRRVRGVLGPGATNTMRSRTEFPSFWKRKK
tara:strand:+ start:199 stop:495 length:297 start_codon:yes stop_codon:yes gene_type:complete